MQITTVDILVKSLWILNLQIDILYLRLKEQKMEEENRKYKDVSKKKKKKEMRNNSFTFNIIHAFYVSIHIINTITRAISNAILE